MEPPQKKIANLTLMIMLDGRVVDPRSKMVLHCHLFKQLLHITILCCNGKIAHATALTRQSLTSDLVDLNISNLIHEMDYLLVPAKELYFLKRGGRHF